MNLRQDDPRLTAYALNELEPEERSAFEAELGDDAEARAEIASIRLAAERLSEELAKAPEPSLSAEQRARIEAALERRGTESARSGGAHDDAEPAPSPEPVPAPVAKLRPRRRWGWVFAAAAALPVVLALGAVTLVSRSPDRSEVAAVAYEEKLKADLPAAPPARALASAAATATVAPTPGEAPLVPGVQDVDKPFDTESYDKVEDNPFVRVAVDPRSTFSIDVDTASYSLVRRFLNDGQRPPKGAVRIEELVNYFSYSYPEPSAGALFTVSTEVNEAPWAPGHRLVRIGLKAKALEMKQRPPSNLVFLVDVSGSMSDPNKLPLLKKAFGLLVQQLDERDRISMVVYAGASGLVLPPTPGDRRGEILGALDRLEAGGSTNGGEGIELAYRTALQTFVKGGVNRVLLATDGDFNVGVTNQSDLIDLVQQKAAGGVFLSVLGFGGGNYNDSTLEKLADKGNGNYAYIDDEREAKKVLVEQATGTLVTIAKDVKIQLELNPKEVEAFRLIGYENRVLAHSDFNDDKKDAGDIGAGHTVTALYEIVPAGSAVPGAEVDGLKYQKPSAPSAAAESGELMTVKLRYKRPDSNVSQLLEVPVRDGDARLAAASADFRFAAGVAAFGMLLRDSPHKGSATFESAKALCESGVGQGADSEARRELVQLVGRAESLSPR